MKTATPRFDPPDPRDAKAAFDRLGWNTVQQKYYGPTAICSWGHTTTDPKAKIAGECRACRRIRTAYYRLVRLGRLPQTDPHPNPIQMESLMRNLPPARQHQNDCCSRGHAYARFGKRPNGGCAECARLRRSGVVTSPLSPARLCVVQKNIRRRARYWNVPQEPYDYNEVVFGQDSCGICGQKYSPNDLRQIDHIVPMSRGGGDVPGNVQSAHAECNERKGVSTP
jgi:hypothetical protein